ncbi:MAG: aldo/keto reductase [Deltaproteobacteria bacterium]|nr:aldo/keto reductase [Deltaproteobacteria bacterium]
MPGTRLPGSNRGAEGVSTIRIGDLVVNRLGFGAMRVCGPQVWGPPRDRKNAVAVLKRAYALGFNLMDTADSYGPHVDEELIAEALHPYPEDLVIATKGGLLRPTAAQWVPDGRPEHLRQAVDGSLRRLKLERIDLYQLHAPDPKVPFADSIGALAELQRQGKIRHLGVSNVDLAKLEEARRLAPIVSVQNAYSLVDRSSEDVLVACEKLGIAFLPWYPLGAAAALRAASVKALAVRRKVSAAQISLAWLLSRSPVMLPIPGTASLAHLEENAGAVGLELSREDLATLAD